MIPMTPAWVPNCADDASVRGARVGARLVQEHHQRNWDLILGRFQEKRTFETYQVAIT